LLAQKLGKEAQKTSLENNIEKVVVKSQYLVYDPNYTEIKTMENDFTIPFNHI
jgi:hypothetical protein